MLGVSADLGLVEAIRAGLTDAADPARAPQMQSYMKSAMPFYGVPAPVAARVFRAAIDAHPLPDRQTWADTIGALWDAASHREEWYAALALARDRRYRGHRDPAAVPMLEHLIRTGAWWDVVDDIATHLVGPLLVAYPDAMRPVVSRWAAAQDRWLRRAAVICQVGAKEHTDPVLLAGVILDNLDDTPAGKDFFLRKAIGWALRDYARHDPDWVRTFVAAHRDRLSGLSRREALRHVGDGLAS